MRFQRKFRKAVRFLALFAWLPLLVVGLLVLVLLYAIGGRDLVTYSLGLAFTAKGALRILSVFLGVTCVAWFGPIGLGGFFWDGVNAPTSSVLRKRWWVNATELAVLVLLALLGIWAISRFGAPR
jgi:hypothetical protein